MSGPDKKCGALLGTAGWRCNYMNYARLQLRLTALPFPAPVPFSVLPAGGCRVWLWSVCVEVDQAICKCVLVVVNVLLRFDPYIVVFMQNQSQGTAGLLFVGYGKRPQV